MWIDTHCHLDMLSTELTTILAQATEKEVKFLVSVATDRASSQKICSYIRQFPNVYGTAGIHPHEAKNATADDFEFIRSCLQTQEKIVAVGECGYDFHYQHSSYKQQKNIFERQLALALSLNYPLIVHSREAEQETRDSLLPFLAKGLKVVLHSFTASAELADFGIEWDCYFSFNGIVTFPKSVQLREILKKIPLHRILIETDAPFLAPTPLRGSKNTPANVCLVGEFLAQTLGITTKEMMLITTQNAKNFYHNLNV